MDLKKRRETLLRVIDKCNNFSIEGNTLKVKNIDLFGEYSMLYIRRIMDYFDNNKDLNSIDFSNMSVYELVHSLQKLSMVNFDIISLMSETPISKEDFIYLYNYLVKYLNMAYEYGDDSADEYIKNLANMAATYIYTHEEKNIYSVAKRCYGDFDNCQRNFERVLMSAVDMNKVVSKNSKGGKK